MGRISRDRRDIYYRRAKEEGFRARSAYKLLQLDDELHFLSPPLTRKEEKEEAEEEEEEEEEEAAADAAVDGREAGDSAAACGFWPSCEAANEVTPAHPPAAAGAAATANCEDSAVWVYPHRAVDLCAAPGSWTQVLRRRLWQNYQRKLAAYEQQLSSSGSSTSSSGSSSNSRVESATDCCLADSAPSSSPPDPPMIVAVDLQEIAPIPGVHRLKGDITHASTVAAILSFFENQPADLVVCDGAPDVTGMRDIDEYIQMQLLLSALSTAAGVLRPGGTFVCKLFRGEQAALVYMQLLTLFADVRCCKPAASRSSSVEAFVVCRGFCPSASPPASLCCPAALDKQPEKKEEHVANSAGSVAAAEEDEEELAARWIAEVTGQLVPFLSCGDVRGLDADRSYELAKAKHAVRPPVQPPTHPAYEVAVLRRKGLLPA
ncbi:hypothetical protein Efla_001084 [Eimeria flavescens]